MINNKIEIINNTGLLDDGNYFVTQKLFQKEQRDIITSERSAIERKIICNSAGQPLLIVSFEYQVTFS